MRAGEFISEKKIGTIRSGNLVIDIDDHAIDRANQRTVNPKQVDQALKKLRTVADQLNAIEPGHRFWAKDPDTGVALGLRRLSGDNRFLFATVVGALTYDSDVPVVELPTGEPLEELSFLGSPCTKDCSGHRAGYAWSQKRSGRQPASWSDSFNRGAALFAAGK